MSAARPNFEQSIADLQEQIDRLHAIARQGGVDMAEEVGMLEGKLEVLKQGTRPPTAVERVQLARHPRRPFTLDYLNLAFTDFIELHGDRAFRDDEAIVGRKGVT